MKAFEGPVEIIEERTGDFVSHICDLREDGEIHENEKKKKKNE